MPRASAFIDVEQVSKRYRNQRVLSNVTLRLAPGQKGALIGNNGVGKSTLLRIIAGLERPNAGSVNMPSGPLLGYLEQEVEPEAHESIEGYLRRITGIEDVQRRMDELATDLNSEARLDEYSELQTSFECLGAYDFERRMQIVLAGFGLGDVGADRPLDALSGGQRSKVALGGILLKGVDVLLLDEPTNNLDLPALLWLENFLAHSPATVLLVSHDRGFIDRVVSKVFEIDWHTREVTTYGGGYTEFLDFRRRELARQKDLFRQQEEEISRLTDSIQQNKDWAALGAKQHVADKDKVGRDFHRERSAGLAKRSKAIEKRLEQMDLVDRPPERAPLDLRLQPAEPSTQQAIGLDDVRIGYTGGFSLGPIDLRIQGGTRAAILGPNGAGKSTLLKVLTGQLAPLSGHVSVNPALVVGNLMQAQENLPAGVSPLWFLQAQANIGEDDAAGLLRAFQLSPLDMRKSIRQNSPGARTRVLLAYFTAIHANALVLDEPTNHLDLEAVETLEEALRSYAGTVLVVSHDRQFLSQLDLTHTFLLQDGRFDRVPSFETYVAGADARARKLLARL
jgi:ATPase subunit of ABC transporter with duplicated ATPase domains